MPKNQPSKNNERLLAIEELVEELLGTRHPHELIRMILEKSLNLLGCDGGSLYLQKDPEHLDFVIAVNRSIDFDFSIFRIPLSKPAIATEVFRTQKTLRIDDVYALDSHMNYSFNRSFDQLNGYRTRSMITVPLSTSKGKCVGVLQLINKKKSTNEAWPSHDAAALDEMPTFNDDDEKLIVSFAAIAAASLENLERQNYIQTLFDSFVQASAHAIDSRDPGTRGHSQRVALMARALAQAVTESQTPPFDKHEFSTEQLREIYFAAILHDFGKIGVREATLSKANKLTAEQRLIIEARIQDFILAHTRDSHAKFLGDLQTTGQSPNHIQTQQLEQSLHSFEKKLGGYLDFIKEMNRPSVLDDDQAEKLRMLRGLKFTNSKGESVPLLTDVELENLAIVRGCLNSEERLEIESHVTKSYEFLTKIPWDGPLARIPEIAWAHHEALDGTGYPRKLTAKDIPFETQILSVCDIFDALAASDRSYKKALYIEETLEIMHGMAKRNKLNQDLVELFEKSEIWKATGHHYSSRARTENYEEVA